MMAKAQLLLLCCFLGSALAVELKFFSKVLDQCEAEEDLVRCLKLQALKVADRAARAKVLPVMDGISVVKEDRLDQAEAAAVPADADLRKLDSSQIDAMLSQTTSRFFATHDVQLNFTQLLSGEEGRGRRKRLIGPLLVALILKAGFLAMAFKGIAAIAAAALMIGKMALLLSSIIGLKKLLSGGGKEKTTFEIVKHPHYSHSNTYSSSHLGDWDESGGHYHRSLNDAEMRMQERAYRAQIPPNRR